MEISKFITSDEKWAAMTEEEKIADAREGHVNSKQIALIEKEGSPELRAALKDYFSRNPRIGFADIKVRGFDERAKSLLEDFCSLARVRASAGFDKPLLESVAQIREQLKLNTWLESEVARLATISCSIRGDVASPFIEAAREASLSALEIFKSAEPRIELAGRLKLITDEWFEILKPKQEIGFPDMRTILEAHLSEISGTSMLAQASLGKIVWEAFGSKVNVPDIARTALRDNYFEFAQSYKDLFKSFEESTSAILSLPPRLSQLPANEFFIGSRLAEAISAEAKTDEIDEERRVEKEISREVEDELRSRLSLLDSSFVKMVDGARESLRSNNPDRVRHSFTSYRELCTHVLHRLSPDDQVRQWSNSREHYANNRPTRKARLLFICRHINHGHFSNFVEKDIAAAVAAFDLLNQGTHEVSTSLNDEQLEALRMRAEHVLHFLLQINRENSHAD